MLSIKSRETIMRRLTADPEWAKSPIGQLAQVLIDTDCVTFKTLSVYFDKKPPAVTRWFTVIKRPGNSGLEVEGLNEKFLYLKDRIRQGLNSGELPSSQENVLRYLQNK